MSSQKKNNKNGMVIISIILNAIAFILLFLPIISVHSKDIFGIRLTYTIAGYQFIFGSGNSFVDFIIDSVENAKVELVLLGIMLMAVPALLSIVSAIVRYLCREKKSGSIVPIVLGLFSIIGVILLFVVTSYTPAIGMILFLIVTGVNVVVNIIILALYDGKHSGKKAGQQEIANNKNVHSLKGISGTYAGAVFEITEQPIWIGRDSSKCNIILDGGKVSRQHCCIWLDKNGKVMFKDTSTNGVYFPNGDRMLSNINMELHSGDTIFVGNSENSFQIV